MSKLTVTHVSNITGNPTSAATTINNNLDAIQTAIENTLSRDGTSPNTMSADLDLNGNQILNLPSAVDDTDPVLLGDLDGLVQDIVDQVAIGPTGPQGPAGADGADGLGVPSGGTTGQLLAKASNADNDTEWVDASSGSSWAFVSSFTWSTNVTSIPFTGLGTYNEIAVVIKNMTTAGSATRKIQVSTDGGSTYLTTSGDYISVSASGAETNDTGMALISSGSTASRSCFCVISANISGHKKFAYSNNTWFHIETTSVIDALKVIASDGGNITGGVVSIFGR